MANMHKRILTSTVILGSLSLVGSSVVWFWGEGMASSVWPEKEEKQVSSASPVRAVVEEAPKEKPQPKPEPEKSEPVQHIQLPEKQQARASTTKQEPKSLQQIWFERVNQGGMYQFGKDNGYTGTGSDTEGGCQILQPVRVRAMIADTSSTDDPGLAWGAVAEDVQGEMADGTYCVAIHAMSVVSFNVGKAGEYATNKAPVQVGEIWMQDGFSIKVDQPGKHIDGSIGVVGVANHHTMSKTFAAIVGGAFTLLDNLTSIGQYNVSSGEVSDPFEKMIDKKLNRPSEISFTGGKVVEFQVLPVSTPGY